MRSNVLNNVGHSRRARACPAPPPLSSTLAAKTANLIGTRVVNRLNENLGTIEEVLIDAAEDRIGYVVLSFCRFLGTGERRYAVPWKAMQYDAELEAFVLNVSQDQIRQVASANEETRPEFIDANGRRKAHVYCELPPFWMP
jgi:sporulation protein YlmC with PRC-barrel domain